MKGVERKRIDDALIAILEDLAHLEHERWSHWQMYVHDKGIRQEESNGLFFQ